MADDPNKPPGPGGTTPPGHAGSQPAAVHVDARNNPFARVQQPAPHGQPPHGQPPHGQQPYPQPQPYAQQPQPYAQQPYAQPNPYPQPNPHAQPQPYAQPQPQPYAQPQPQPNPYAQPPPQVQPQQLYAQQAPMPGAHALPQAAPPTGWTLSPTAKAKASVGRALRLRIEPHEVRPSERQALVRANPPVLAPFLQAFLAWRKSVLLLVAVMLVPLTILKFKDAAELGLPDNVQWVFYVPALAEGVLCIVCWYQLKNWMSWRKQRTVLWKSWLFYMAAPFLVFLVPIGQMVADTYGETVQATELVVFKATIGVYALITLAPKAVSLLAGSVRAGLVTKMLFPGSAGPGWLVVIAAPLYTLFVFTLLIVPYQISGNGWFMGAMISLLVAEVVLGRLGYRLAKPTTHDAAVAMVAKGRSLYLLGMIGFGVCLLVALGSYAEKVPVTTIISTVLSFQTNVLLLTLIGSDLVITGLARAHGLTTGGAQLISETNSQLIDFVGNEQPAAETRP